MDKPKESSAPPRTGLWRLLRWFVLALLLIVIGASLAGYSSGLSQRARAEAQAARERAGQQYELGLKDLDEGRYELAKQRFEYVISIDPSHPEIAEKLAEALLVLNQPTPVPTVEASPTPNLAPAEEMFSQAEAALATEDWSLAINTLLALRAKDAGYRSVDVDGMMYLALRNRGVNRIANEGTLEEGMYDLALAQTFGPLDRDARNWKDWAELYLKANSYMGVNWPQAVSYFAQVYLVAPYLRNDAYIKYAISAQGYADLLMDVDDPCAAVDYYEESLLAWDNATLYPTATKAHDKCETATTKPRPTRPPDTPTPPAETPTASSTPEGGGEGAGDGNGNGG